MSNDFSNLFSVKGKTVVITGGSRGIGEMLAAGYLASGARVIISSRKADACEETVERLTRQFETLLRDYPAGSLPTATVLPAIPAPPPGRPWQCCSCCRCHHRLAVARSVPGL